MGMGMGNRVIHNVRRQFTIMTVLIIVIIIEGIPVTNEFGGHHRELHPATLSSPIISPAAQHNLSLTSMLQSNYVVKRHFSWNCYNECSNDCHIRYWCGGPDKYFNHCINVCILLCTFDRPPPRSPLNYKVSKSKAI